MAGVHLLSYRPVPLHCYLLRLLPLLSVQTVMKGCGEKEASMARLAISFWVIEGSSLRSGLSSGARIRVIFFVPVVLMCVGCCVSVCESSK